MLYLHTFTKIGAIMRTDIIAVDLETTGLDVEKDAIIEIGAVRLRDGQVVDEYSVLINPGFAIPSETTFITGITQEDLRGAPSLKDVLPQLGIFVGSAPIIAHNAAFDVSFLRRFGAIKDNPVMDTIEMASILMPKMPRYNLGSLTAMMGIQLEQAHRALDDARATAFLYWKLWEKAIQLPYNLLQDTASNALLLNWELASFFNDALQNHVGDKNPQSLMTFGIYTTQDIPLKSKTEIQPIHAQKVGAYLDVQGALAQSLDRFERREEQITLTHAISDALDKSQHLIAEAGTGTGKSLAYLIPAVEWATTNNQRVVIATNTINLQEQLLYKDVPLVETALQKPFIATVMKGRGNYLCPRRLEAIRRRRPTTLDELRILTKILIWLQESQSGDKGEITLRGNEYSLWTRLSAEDESCSIHRCEAVMNGVCPFYKARKRAETAHIVIANHALLISDAISENRVLPDYKYLVVDEAHQLEEAVTNGLSIRADQTTLMRRLADLGGVNNGFLGDLLHSIQAHISEKQYLRLEAFVQNIGDVVRDMGAMGRVFFAYINQWMRDLHGDSTGSTRITRKERDKAGYAKVQAYWTKFREYLDAITEAMGDLVAFLKKFEENNIPSFDDHLNSTVAASQYFAELRQLLFELTTEPNKNKVYWVDTYANPDYTAIQSAPLHIGEMMEQYLWNSKNSVVLTSATLETNDSFEYVTERLSAEHIKTLHIGSPFDYKQSTLLYLPQDMPEPAKPGYQQAVEKGIIELAAALDGRVLVLFTSYAQLRETASGISARLALGNITVLDQAPGSSRDNLIDGFRSTKRSVLLGTKSFWQGIDLPGDDLLGLVIVKLPFAVPTDPVFSARSETYQNSFDEYAVPDAILRFRQGFGRLIRTQQDRGIVTIFDSRIIHKGYGKTFLHALPDCTVKKGSLSDLANSAKTWLADKL
jgi:ATP-dependent DNA helicase DinG